MSKVHVTDLPNSTSQWLPKYELVQKLFKARICSFGVDTIFWPDHENENLESWFSIMDHSRRPRPGATQECFKYIDDILDFPDISMTDWYDGKSNDELVVNTEKLLQQANVKLNYYDVETPLEIRLEIGRIQRNLKKWLATLTSILQTPTALLSERMYEECFRIFAEIWDLNCQSGDAFASWSFGYEYSKGNDPQTQCISSKPDLILYNINPKNQPSGVAVVEVKKVTDPTAEWNQLESQETGATSEVKKMKLTEEEEKEDSLNAPLLEEKYVNGLPRKLTQAQRSRCELFLPQLLGEVVAATNNTVVKFQRVWHCNENHRSIFGVAVLGLDVQFANFITVTHEVRINKKFSLHQIPITKGVGLDILISEPLSLLKRQDRRKLLKALFALHTMSYVVWD